MNPRITVTIGSMLLAATTLVGCGSNGSSSYTPPTSPSATATPTPATPTPTPPTSTPNPAPVPTVAGLIIAINGMDGAQSYSPNPATVAAGQTVSWVNKDSLPHTATSNTGAFTTGLLAPGQTSAPITMGTPGAFAYHCEVHPSMTGSLAVVQPVR
jgi:plastocyanin